MEMEIRKMEVVRLDVVEKDELMACSQRTKDLKILWVGESEFEKKWKSSDL